MGEEVSSCPGFALSGASCYSQYCHWPLPQFNWSSEAIQTSFSQLGIMEQSTWVRFEEEEEVAMETSRRTSRTKNISTSSSLSSSLSSVGSTSMERRMPDFQDEEHLDILLPLLLSLLGRVDVDGEANGGLHSSSGRGAVLGAPERQVRGAAGPARHL